MEPILIDIKQHRPGFAHFIASWFCKGETNIVVDVGPANSVHILLESLDAMHVDRVDFVLLTHIHIDHAGGLADFLENFPMAKIVCHAMGLRHLVDPSKPILSAKARPKISDLPRYQAFDYKINSHLAFAHHNKYKLFFNN